ncbi:CPCC family cysteine-rich protein [Alkalicoccobacillus gibsonii]|uniref:CPCC family cysteine-rich protein n=1 Tax=Alkalicoccobacillus gibsonii TaxID=79881 RepID=UPI00193221E6|nr:CPCC family cysteine-rich protein [Alkalicoccobacillus gibsonii]MBM0065513.1 hypothetical protein [Alkalicoccobacillus gibsonii]
MIQVKFACLCCGYKTLEKEPPGTYDICEVCYWEDDDYQYAFQNELGANRVTIKEAKRNFLAFGACERDLIPYTCKPKTK